MAQTEIPIDLPKRSDLTSARPLRAALLDADAGVILRAGEVELLTSPVLQVLMAARRDYGESGRDITLAMASSAFDDCLAVLGATRRDICTVDKAGAAE
ncbi:MAG: STAS domain-containing protein [Pseudomonadota bacterium]